MAAAISSPFNRETLRFLEQLADNNERDWFNTNKTRYEEQVLDPALEFIDAMQAPLEKIAPHFTAIPKRMGGSLMRVYRDTRFAKNKAPYKTNIGIQFRHEQAKDVHAPGYYLHIEPGMSFLGVGMWRPDSDSLRRIRERIAARTADWQRAVGDKRLRRHFALAGESLTRPPRGFDRDHPAIEDIKRKSYIAVKDLDPDACLKPGFQRSVITAYDAARPLMQFLCKAVNVPF